MDVDGQLLASGGGSWCVDTAAWVPRGDATRAAASLRFGIAFGAGAATAGFGAGSVTTASVSCTGRSAVRPGDGAAAAGGWICADTGAGTAFCRDAR